MADTIIELFTGNIGSGKSYSAVERIYQHLLRGGHVYTNIALVQGAVIRQALLDGFEIDFPVQYHFLNNEQILDFPRHISSGSSSAPVLVVIDEIHLYFNSRDWQKTGKGILTFLSQTRKLHVNIMGITQHEANLDGQFRRLVQFIWRHTDLAKVVIPVFQIPLNIPIIQAAMFDGQVPSIKYMVQNKRKKKCIFDMYESTALLVEIQIQSMLAPVNVRRLDYKQRTFQHLKSFGLPLSLCEWVTQ